jgi:hypothetical protein
MKVTGSGVCPRLFFSSMQHARKLHRVMHIVRLFSNELPLRDADVPRILALLTTMEEGCCSPTHLAIQFSIYTVRFMFRDTVELTHSNMFMKMVILLIIHKRLFVGNVMQSRPLRDSNWECVGTVPPQGRGTALAWTIETEGNPTKGILHTLGDRLLQGQTTQASAHSVAVGFIVQDMDDPWSDTVQNPFASEDNHQDLPSHPVDSSTPD